MQQGFFFFFLYKNSCDKKPISMFCHCNHVPEPEVTLWWLVLLRGESFKASIFLFVGLDGQLCAKKSKWDTLFHVIVKHVFFMGTVPFCGRSITHSLFPPFPLQRGLPATRLSWLSNPFLCLTHLLMPHQKKKKNLIVAYGRTKNKMSNLHWLWQILTVLTWRKCDMFH